MRRLVLVLLSCLFSACGGGGGPASPSRSPAPLPSAARLPPPQAVDAITGAAIAAVITPAEPGRNERATIRAPGYLVREQLYTGEPIRLWPAKNEGLVRQLVYAQVTTGTEIRMRRWEEPGFVMGLPPEIADVPRARETFERAAAQAFAATGLAIGIGAGGPVRVVIDPQAFFNQPRSCAFARTWLRGDVITQAEIVYPNAETALGLANRCDPFGVAAHELGHVLGLQHVDDPTALMNPTPLATSYNAWEEESLWVMYHHRRAGNGAPDREAGLVASDARVRVEVIVD